MLFLSFLACFFHCPCPRGLIINAIFFAALAGLFLVALDRIGQHHASRPVQFFRDRVERSWSFDNTAASFAIL